MFDELEIRNEVREKLQKSLEVICGQLNDKYPDLTFYIRSNDTLMVDQSDVSPRDIKIYKL